jgi:hypothetical protein
MPLAVEMPMTELEQDQGEFALLVQDLVNHLRSANAWTPAGIAASRQSLAGVGECFEMLASE